MKRARNLLAHALLAAVVSGLVAGASSGCGGGQKEAKEPEEGEDIGGSRRSMGPDIGEEEEPDDGMEVEGLRGRLDPYDIQQGMEPHANKLMDCYTKRITRENRYIGGDVEFRYIVNRDGTVKLVHLTRSDLGAWEMEQCMLDISLNITFRKPKGGGDAEFTVPLSFTARAAITVWDEARAQGEVTDEKRAELAACAAETSSEDPQNLLVTVYVGTRGMVLSTGFASPGGPISPEWMQCAARKITAWTLSDPRGQVAKATFTYNPQM